MGFRAALQQQEVTVAGRGYSVSDLVFLMATGMSSGMMAVLVLTLYIHNPDITGLSPSPRWLWLPLRLFPDLRVLLRAVWP
jgi:hypothetical protein